MPDFDAHYNIAPSSNIVAVRATAQGRSGCMMRWGLIPSWAKDPASLPMLHNARPLLAYTCSIASGSSVSPSDCAAAASGPAAS